MLELIGEWREGVLQVYIVVSEIKKKKLSLTFALPTIIIVVTVKFKEQPEFSRTKFNSCKWRKSVREKATGS